jgi:hypothetical protein
VTDDHGYQSALTTARVLFVPASANDQMWRHV